MKKKRSVEARLSTVFRSWCSSLTSLVNWPIPASFLVNICLFPMIQFKHKLIKVQMVYLGLEPGAAGWKVQTNLLNYYGTPMLVQIGL